MEFYCTEVDNKSYTTKQLCYICEKLDGVYLRRQELTDLWCISPQFPVHLSTPPLHSKAVCTTDNSEQCSCPTRPDHPPPLPTEVPPSIDIAEAGSVDKLKEWILNYYESTAFNTCKHQPLHYMTGSPLQLHVDPQATPVACHKVVPIPLHWRERVKADLERDVRIGVLEKRENPVIQVQDCLCVREETLGT